MDTIKGEFYLAFNFYFLYTHLNDFIVAYTARVATREAVEEARHSNFTQNTRGDNSVNLPYSHGFAPWCLCHVG